MSVLLWCGVWCLWCGVGGRDRGMCLVCVWCEGCTVCRVCGGTLKNPQCVHSKRPRVYRQHVHMYQTCGRGASTHGDVLNVHRGRFERTHGDASDAYIPLAPPSQTHSITQRHTTTQHRRAT